MFEMAADKAKEASQVWEMFSFFLEIQSYIIRTNRFLSENLFFFLFKGSLTLLTTDIENEIDSSPCKSSTKVSNGENMFNYLILPR